MACDCRREHLSCTRLYLLQLPWRRCCDPHTTLGLTQTIYDHTADIYGAASEEIVDGYEDAVVVADEEVENAGNNNMHDEGDSQSRLCKICVCVV